MKRPDFFYKKRSTELDKCQTGSCIIVLNLAFVVGKMYQVYYNHKMEKTTYESK